MLVEFLIMLRLVGFVVLGNLFIANLENRKFNIL